MEIVAKLVSLGLIDVIYTTDGKEYLTHQQLQKEISDEVYINGGRLELPELANLLNVDFSQVEAQVIMQQSVIFTTYVMYCFTFHSVW